MMGRSDREREERRRDEAGDAGEAAGEQAAPGEEGELEALRAQLDELHQKYLRTIADYQNSQKRAAANEREARQQGMTSVILSVLGIVDHFDLALGQDPRQATAEQIVRGVRVIREELMRVLGAQGVGLVHPEPNAEFDPVRHQAVMQQDAPDIEPGRVVATLQAGYTLGERIIRPAKVSVKPAG